MTEIVAFQGLAFVIFLLIACRAMWFAMAFARRDSKACAVGFIIISLVMCSAAGWFLQGAVHNYYGWTTVMNQ